jgi:hypothetical protein
MVASAMRMVPPYCTNNHGSAGPCPARREEFAVIFELPPVVVDGAVMGSGGDQAIWEEDEAGRGYEV